MIWRKVEDYRKTEIPQHWGGPLLKIWIFKEMKESSEEEFEMRQILRDVTDVTKTFKYEEISNDI